MVVPTLREPGSKALPGECVPHWIPAFLRVALAAVVLCLPGPAAFCVAGEDPPQEPLLEDAAPPEPPAEATQAEEPEPGSVEGKKVIGQIVVDGNVRVSDSAFFTNLRVKTLDDYDEKAIRQEFRRLWELNLFDEISIESRQRLPGVYDLIFHVRDRPLISSVAYVGMKAITETNIQEKLSQAKAEIRRGQPVDFSILRRAEAAIEHLLSEKGYLEAKARAHLSPVLRGQQEVTFQIREGGKTKIKKIDFIGNTVLTDRQLRKLLKLTKQAFWMTSWASSKPLYHPAKLDQDAENIRLVYKSRGYLDIAVQPEIVELESEVKRRERLGKATNESPPTVPEPIVEEEPAAEDEDEDEAGTTLVTPPDGETEKERRRRVKAEEEEKKEREKEPKKWVYLTIPIAEGIRYHVGRIEIEGNTVFSNPEILSRVPLRPGMVFNDAVLKLGTKRVEEDYGERGYFYVSIDPRLEKHDGVADLKLEVTEDKKYFVDRIEFNGNTTTRDAVLRREFRLAEQDLFNVKLLRLGLRKVGQLGYWQASQDPVVNPQGDSGKVDIQVQGAEANKNEIQVGGGVSGLDGGFFQASYSTRNFLGRGEILSANIQVGASTDRYAINFTEPYFFGKPWTLGVSLFRTATDYVDFRQFTTGGAIVLGRRLGNFSRFDLSFGTQVITADSTQAGFEENSSVSTTNNITTLYTIDTRNNFFHPTRGARLQTAVQYAGGPLGGDNSFVKPRLDATLYFPGFLRRHYIGVNASYGYVVPFGGRVVPTYERYFLGGERSLRLYKSRTVSPERADIDVNGNGFINFPEDRNPDGIFEPCEDTNGNGVLDGVELDRGNCLLDPTEDANHNGVLDCEDGNHNGILDPGEDLNGNGQLDCEDVNGNGGLDPAEDQPDGQWTPFCPVDDPNLNGVRDLGESDHGNCRLDPGEDTNQDGVYGTVFPGGNQFLVFNVEYTMPLSDTVEFSMFYDAGNAFDDGEAIRLSGMRVDYGFEMRFYLPVFQAPLRLIYGFIERPQPGEDASNFIFSIGTTF
jgi:outer membrane protein insertion porin family